MSEASTVLVVDDEIAIQRFLAKFLAAKAFNVKVAPSVDEAIPVLERDTVDAVVLDVRMPRRSGLELLEYVRSEEKLRELPVLILTGAVLTEEEEALIARYRGYVFYKSEDQETLAGYLDQLTGKS